MSSTRGANQYFSDWRPTMFVRFEQGLGTSMGTARIVTDAGPAFIKAMGNPEGLHALACELVATQLARWFDLPTLDYAVISLDAEFDEIPFLRGGFAASGPAFVTKAIRGHTWGGTTKELESLVNPGDVSRLILFDTWLRNCDRHPPDLERRGPNCDNVFLQGLEGPDDGKCRLIAMDHTHCFTCGRDLSHRVGHDDHVRDDRLYGLFPGFRPLVRQEAVDSAVQRLRELESDLVRMIVETIPREWEVDTRSREALAEFLIRRADFVARTIGERIRRSCWPDQLFDTGI